MKRCGVYAITHKETGCRYIGSSVDIDDRWRNHARELGLGVHCTRKLQALWAQSGASGFDFSVVAFCGRDDRLLVEQWHIDATPRELLLNSAIYAASPSSDPEVAARISARRLGVPAPWVAESNKRRAGEKRRPRTDEEKRQLSVARTGRQFGKRAAAVGRKISATLSGRPHTEARKANISRARKGKPLTEAQLAHLSSLHSLLRMRAQQAREI